MGVSNDVAFVTAEMDVTGMHCQSCVALIEETLSETEGVARASVDLEGASAVVEYDPAAVSLDDLLGLVTELGYEAAARPS